MPGLAVVGGLLLMVGVAVSFFVGLPGTFENLGGPAPRSDVPPPCLALTYAPPGDFRWMPDTVRLTPAVYFRSEHGTWYRATYQQYREFGWRPAGADSVDLAGHHTPVLRLPARGAHRVGRGGWPGFTNIWNALTSREWRVEAREVACPPDRSPHPSR